MARKVFYSFHYKEDCSRAALVRNMGVIEGNEPAADNDWESITSGGDPAIEKWINSQMNGRTCAVFLIGKDTAGRKWINYEIKTAWQKGLGIVGIHIHNLSSFGSQSQKGKIPWAGWTIKDVPMTNIVKTYDPPYSDSKLAYGYINNNIASWIEEATQIRQRY
jgi:hypothetical protein